MFSRMWDSVMLRLEKRRLEDRTRNTVRRETRKSWGFATLEMGLKQGGVRTQMLCSSFSPPLGWSHLLRSPLSQPEMAGDGQRWSLGFGAGRRQMQPNKLEVETLMHKD